MAACKNIICHTDFVKERIKEIGVKSNIFVIPHGCLNPTDTTKYWNFFKNDKVIINFGFGFDYKGIDKSLETIKLLKVNHSDVFYIYLCATSPNFKIMHSAYCRNLLKKSRELGIEENVAIIQGFNDDKILNNYFKTVRGCGLFSYYGDNQGFVAGASGSIRHVLPYLPCVASDESICHQFTELPIPKANSPEGWATIIDKIFTDKEYTSSLMNIQKEYIQKNSWENIGVDFFNTFKQIINLN